MIVINNCNKMYIIFNIELKILLYNIRSKMFPMRYFFSEIFYL